MDPLTFARSQNEESDFAAERRWESEGGNPGELQQVLRDDRKEDTTTGRAVEAAIPIDIPASKNS
jgi:hypothetical protein